MRIGLSWKFLCFAWLDFCLFVFVLFGGGIVLIFRKEPHILSVHRLLAFSSGLREVLGLGFSEYPQASSFPSPYSSPDLE